MFLQNEEIMKNFKQILNESGLNRVYQASQKHDTGTMSAFRSSKDCLEGESISKKENRSKNRKLKALLLKAGYGVTAIKGTYIEGYKTSSAREVDEESFLVVDLEDNGNLKQDLII